MNWWLKSPPIWKQRCLTIFSFWTFSFFVAIEHYYIHNENLLFQMINFCNSFIVSKVAFADPIFLLDALHLILLLSLVLCKKRFGNVFSFYFIFGKLLNDSSKRVIRIRKCIICIQKLVKYWFDTFTCLSSNKSVSFLMLKQ